MSAAPGIKPSMLRLSWHLVASTALIVAASGTARAAEAPGPGGQSGKDDRKSDEEKIAEILRKTPQGYKPAVWPDKVAVCPICKQPYWRHAEGVPCEPRELPEGYRVARVAYRQTTCPVCQNRFRAPLPNEFDQR